MTSRSEPIGRALSERIACTRALCILGMIYVHVPGAALEDVGRVLDATDPTGSLQAFLVEGYGRASAAMLSVISGWLCARALLGGRMKPLDLVRRRVRTMVVPMLFWGLATLVFYGFVSVVQPTFLTPPPGESLASTVLRYVNSVVFLTEAPMGPTLHLSFMRDLFVCVLLTPVLLAALAWRAWLLLLALGLLYLTGAQTVVILRPLILFAFALGLWLKLRGTSLRGADGLLLLWFALSSVATIGILLVNGGHFHAWDAPLARFGLDLRESVLYPLTRLFGALALWSLTARFVGTRAGRTLSRQSPVLFTTYCSHYLILTVLYFGLWLPLTGNRGEGPVFFAWFIVAPLVALCAARVFATIVAHWLPGLARLLGLERGGARAEGGRDEAREAGRRHSVSARR